MRSRQGLQYIVLVIALSITQATKELSSYPLSDTPTALSSCDCVLENLPCFGNITVGGAIGTRARSSSMKYRDSLSKSVCHRKYIKQMNKRTKEPTSIVHYVWRLFDCATMGKPAPFCGDLDAINERDLCDYTTRITHQMAKAGNTNRRIRVYADGIYDLFHQGHAQHLMQAKNVFPNVYLIVGVCGDKLTHSKKGRTVMNDMERYEAVRNNRYVDEIVPEAPWEISDEFLEKHKIDFVAHDEIPYANDGSNDLYAHIKARGMFVATKRIEGVSTSNIIARIVKDYDLYLRRNLARGYTADDLNISFLKEKQIQFQDKMDELKNKGKRVITEVSGYLINKWKQGRSLIKTLLF